MAESADKETSEVGEREKPKSSVESWITWQSILYLLVVGWVSIALSPTTGFWWIFPIFALAAPVAYSLIERSRPPLEKPNAKNMESELLATLSEHGETTSTTAAMHTSLTVDEAAKMLEVLARKGHLELCSEDGVTSYALMERDRKELPEKPSAAPEIPAAETPQPPGDPLSEREMEVLALLSSGRTNAEISSELFVALGTVKAHVNNIYRKLGAKNRAEAISRARELGVL